MFTVCEGCLEGANIDCPLYVLQTKDGFIFIGCIVLAIELDAYILGRVQLDLGGDDD
jgi:hypothetical protein